MSQHFDKADPVVRIETDGIAENTVITIDGKPVTPVVTGIDVRIRPNELVTATITFEDVDLDITAKADGPTPAP